MFEQVDEEDEDDESGSGSDIGEDGIDSAENYSEEGEAEFLDRNENDVADHDAQNESQSESKTSETDDFKRQIAQQLLKEEQKNIMNRLSESARTDAEKGRAVQHQMNIYEGVLESRINIQKALSGAMELPLNKESSKKIQTERTSNLLEQALVSSLELLLNLSELRLKLMKHDDVVDSSFSLTKKRTLSDAFEIHKILDEKLNQYRDGILVKWSRRVQSSSGSAALNSTKFKSLNQTADVQVKSILADMDRLVKRTRLNRSGMRALGSLDESTKQGKFSEDRQPTKIDHEEDPYIFDDQDFYRLLLKDLVDKRMADSSAASGVKWTAAKPNKIKKNVDTKASKGRKLRYHVQEKIQGFGAPRSRFTWTEEQIDELFSSLLGQRIRINEESENEGSEEEVEVENDGLQIFG